MFFLDGNQYETTISFSYSSAFMLLMKKGSLFFAKHLPKSFSNSIPCTLLKLKTLFPYSVGT
jgi:hypothetical protein